MNARTWKLHQPVGGSPTRRYDPPMTTAQVGELVAGSARSVLAGRLVAAALTLLTMPLEQRLSRLVAVAVLVAAVTSSVALHRWNGIGSLVLRHPLVLGLDAVPVVVVLALVGDDSPWLLAMLSTAVLAGLFYGSIGAAVFSVLLVSGQGLGLAVNVSQDGRGVEVFGTVVVPLLVVGSASAAAGVRRLLERLAASTREAHETATRFAAVQERARLARELHDSVAKTLHGVALNAQVLKATVHICPDRAAAQAELVAAAAATAASESRSLLCDLRDAPPPGVLADTVREAVTTATAGTGVEALVDVDAPALDARLPADVRREVVAILREALDNVVRHADARTIRVTLRQRDGAVELVVRDDGVGIPEPVDPVALSRKGHHGLLGMTERARQCQGSLEVRAAEGGGTVMMLSVRLTGGPDSEAAIRVPGPADRRPLRPA